MPANLQEAVDKAIELEASCKLAEGVYMAHPIHNPEIMSINQVEYQENTPMTVEEIIDQKIKNNTCFNCGEVGHLHQNCPHNPKLQVDQDNDIIGQINHTLMAKTPINTIFLQTLFTKLGAMRTPKES